jgi:DNA modification methylase
MWKTTTTKKERRGNFKSVAHQLGLFVMIIDTLPISSIKLNPNNPRLVKDDKFTKLVKSIQDFPQMLKIRPIVVNDDMIVLGGNMRLKACKEAGLKEVPVIKASSLTEEQQKEFIIKDNVGFGEWDWDMIANEWDQEQITEWGLDIPDFAVKNLEAEEDDYEIPDTIETDIVLGDLFEIGQHRLLCGDSTDSDAVARLMNGQKAELLFTSPPYSDMRDYNGEKDLSVSNLIEFIPTFMPYVNYQVVNLGIQRKDHEIVQYWDEYIETAKACGYKLLSWNIWDKMLAGSVSNQNAMFAIEHEWIFVFGTEPKKLNRTVEKSEESARRLKSSRKNAQGQPIRQVRQADGSMKMGTKGKDYDRKNMPTVLQLVPQMGRDEFTTKHPATFPVTLPSEHIQAMSNEGDIVIESFTGSGTTMVAAHQLNRKCYGMELDPKYCQITIDRMLKLDPSLEIKRNGQPYKTKELQSA